MILIRTITTLIALTMLSAITIAFVNGDFFGEGSHLLTMPWGIVSLVDIYTAMIFFSAWTIYRERSWLAFPWLISYIVLGSLGVALYILLATLRSNNTQELLLGRSHRSPTE
jgi:hypothetical protein